jgi:hypothetical protein
MHRPTKVQDGQVVQSKEVTQLTLKDTQTTWELTKDAKITLADGTRTDTVLADDEVELTLRGPDVTEVKILNR